MGLGRGRTHGPREPVAFVRDRHRQERDCTLSDPHSSSEPVRRMAAIGIIRRTGGAVAADIYGREILRIGVAGCAGGARHVTATPGGWPWSNDGTAASDRPLPPSWWDVPRRRTDRPALRLRGA